MGKNKSAAVLRRLDREVDSFVRRTRFFNEALTPGRARMFVLQHRLNTRQRNSVLKLKVATNCPDWDTRIRIILEEQAFERVHDQAAALLAARHLAHWEIIEELGQHIGLPLKKIRAAQPLATTQTAWAAWEGLMANRHWLEGIVANTCAERANVPGPAPHSTIVKSEGSPMRWNSASIHRASTVPNSGPTSGDVMKSPRRPA